MCGSGRKYKNCCLPLQQERNRWNPLEDKVRALIEEFVTDMRFEETLRTASSLFGFDAARAGLAEERLFYDWYIHDYVIPAEGRSIINLLQERVEAQRSNEETRRTLSSWASSTFSFLEVLQVRKGTGLMVKDMFRGSEYFVWDVKGSNSLSRYDVLFCRPYAVERIVRIASGSIDLPQKVKAKVREYVETARRERGGGLDDYLRSQSLPIIQYLRTAFTKSPTLVTSEGDIIVFSRCEYTIRDPEGAIDILDSSEEFVDVGEEKGALRYDWVKKVGEQDEDVDAVSSHDEALRLLTYLTDKETGEQFLVLGNLSLTGDRLEVSCTSDRRLQSCKALVESLLGRLIMDRSKDEYTETVSVHDEGVSQEEEEDGEEEEIPPEVEDEIAKDFFEKYYAKWIRTKIPSLGNMTPLEASKTEDGRSRLEEILRIAENEAERSAGRLKPPTAKLREQLGL